MSKITKKQLQEGHNKLLNQFASLVRELKVNNVIDDSVCPTFTKKTEPKLKQLDQSIFNGLDEKWRFAAVDSDGDIHVYDGNPTLGDYEWVTRVGVKFLFIAHDYDASNWQNSLIERDTAKELLEVDLSIELTGSDLARAMLANASKQIMCAVSDISTSKAMSLGNYDLIHDYTDEHSFMSLNQTWVYAIPINNQGEPLTQAEAGL